MAATTHTPILHNRPDSGMVSCESKPRRLLMLTHRAPFPPNRGDRIRAYNILKELSTNWNVSLACVNDEPIADQHLAELNRLCESVAVEEVGATRWLRAARYAAQGKSFTEGFFHSKSLMTTIRKWTHAKSFDCALVYCSSMLQYVEGLNAPIVSDLVDVDSEKWRELSVKFQGSWKKWVYGLEAKRVRQLEHQVVQRSEAITLVSEDEANLFRNEVCQQKPVLGVGNGVDVDYFRTDAIERGQHTQPLRLVFVGVLDYFPNVEGVTWFVDEVLPLLRKETACLLQLVGRRPNAAISRIVASSDAIELHADVPDVREFLSQAHVVIAPLRLARGIQNKVLEAMACGRAVVLSQEAAVGVEGINNEHFHVGESAREFADQILRLAASPDLRQRTGIAARRLIESRYSWQSRLRPLCQLLEQVSRPSASPEVMAG